MTEDDRWNLLVELDEELLKGGVILSEWCCFIVREADTAFVKQAHLASILTAVAGIETYLRSEYMDAPNQSLYELIEQYPIDNELKKDLHKLRKYRNNWVHVDDPWDDNELLENPTMYEKNLEEMALVAARSLRRTIYENPWI